jgi:hypothetical protein
LLTTTLMYLTVSKNTSFDNLPTPCLFKRLFSDRLFIKTGDEGYTAFLLHPVKKDIYKLSTVSFNLYGEEVVQISEEANI